MKYRFLLFGIVFGFLLSRAGATQFELMAELFLFKDLHLLWVIATAVIVGILGFQLLRRFGNRVIFTGEPMSFKGRPMRRGMLFGALIFGAGWGLTGTCPGAAPAMLGEGKIMVLIPLLGMFAGTYLFGFWQTALKKPEERKDKSSESSACP
ncbi:MAG: DUF6691 family protein [Thiotrichales bacterium]